jgi:hypothetical protein
MLKSALILSLLIATSTLFSQNTIPSSGNVGIGTTTPSALLDVNGNMVVDSSVVIKDSLNVQKKLIVDQDLKIKGEAVFVGDGKFKDKLIVDGLTKLNGDLKIKSLADSLINNLRLVVIKGNGTLSAISIGIDLPPGPPTSNCTMVLPWSKANTLNPSASSNSIALCPSYADVGIGNFNPEAKLHVYAPIQTGLIVQTDHQNDYGYGIQSKVSKDLTKAITVYNTNSSSETFKVYGNGHVYATKIMVRNTPFPDYVFDKNYELMPLSELEDYININKHLPNMPTAKTVENEGADLGEINRVLVEKTEELTLYVIELKKELDRLKLEIDNLIK